MKRFSFAIAATASLMLAGCGGGNDDTINEVDINAAQTEELNELSMDAANDAANSLEMEALGNQAAELEQETDANAALDVETTNPDTEAMNVAGM